jgi:nucleoside diphosphate kinase
MSTPAFWNQHVFVLLTPDAILRGIQREFIHRLRAEDFTPVAATLVQSDSDMIDDLYADVIAGHWETWRYRMIDDAFSLAPCLGLICRYDGIEGDPHAVMRHLKGHQHPAKTSPGELRRDFGAVNSIIGVMHASDNPEESEKDARIFGLAAEDAGPVSERIDLLCALTTPVSPEHRDFDAVLGQLRAAIVVAFLHRLGDPGTVDRLRAVLGRGWSPAGGSSSLTGVDPANLAAPGAGTELAQLCAQRIPGDLLHVLACEFTETTRGSRRGAELFATIRRHGLELDPWQRVVLESSLYFEPERRRW